MPIRGESISRYNEDEMKKVKNIYKNVYADSSSKCVSASRSTMRLAPPSSTGNVSKHMQQDLQPHSKMPALR